MFEHRKSHWQSEIKTYPTAGAGAGAGKGEGERVYRKLLETERWKLNRLQYPRQTDIAENHIQTQSACKRISVVP